ncbi:cytochrome P450 [Variovorax sp. J22P168]|uniref:cytochrome P450 n=1 Tax=Variovorax jilinensis TaxID=3053513 RepID=UPI0025758129|nr:cytochrome P450 [Variovorax sp. J22P168]MDM0014470.1 cytochrome P450 [Variovorax sp. J22P168]
MPGTTVLRRIDQLPGPRGSPLIGNLLQIDGPRFHLQLEQWAREHGDYYQLRTGRRRLLVVGDHAGVAATLRDRPDGFKRTTRMEQVATEMGLKPGLFGANGDDWRRQRRMVMAGFDPAHVRHYFPSLQKVGQRLAGRWAAAAREGRAIDLQADLMRYTVDTIAGLAFGAEVNTLESDGDVIQQHLDKIFPALVKRMLAPLPTWRLLPSRADRALKQGVEAVNLAVDGFIADARARMAADPSLRAAPRNLLEAMIAAADEPGSGIDDAQVSGNVMTMLLAGEDTTANTIAWMIDLLWRHPAALRRAVDEVRRVLGDASQPGFEQLAQLDYIEACAHETMRLKPVAPILALQAERDTTIGDVAVPAGTVVIDLMRRDSVSDSHLPNAAAFDPDRWLADGPASAIAGSAKRTSMPFGAGPRICPGRYLALLEMKMAMAQLLGRFDIEGVDTPDGLPAREHLSFKMTPVGLRLRLRLRS